MSKLHKEKLSTYRLFFSAVIGFKAETCKLKTREEKRAGGCIQLVLKKSQNLHPNIFFLSFFVLHTDSDFENNKNK